MDKKKAIGRLSALAQETRLMAFRFLVSICPEGTNAGDIARHCRVPHNTMSTHLAVLERSGLIDSEKQGREILYRADIEGLRALMEFLARDCCGGRPEICSTVFGDLSCAPKERARTRKTAERLRG